MFQSHRPDFKFLKHVMFRYPNFPLNCTCTVPLKILLRAVSSAAGKLEHWVWTEGLWVQIWSRARTSVPVGPRLGWVRAGDHRSMCLSH